MRNKQMTITTQIPVKMVLGGLVVTTASDQITKIIVRVK